MVDVLVFVLGVLSLGFNVLGFIISLGFHLFNVFSVFHHLL